MCALQAMHLVCKEASHINGIQHFSHRPLFVGLSNKKFYSLRFFCFPFVVMHLARARHVEIYARQLKHRQAACKLAKWEKLELISKRNGASGGRRAMAVP